MKHVTIVVPEGEGNNLSSIVGAYKIFSRANDLWKQRENETKYKIQLAGISEQVDFYDGAFSVKPHLHLSDIEHTNLIIIPSLNHHFGKAVAENQFLIDWVKQQYQQGAEVASICTGAYILASGGLLDGLRCSTHWSAANHFQVNFPQVKLEPDSLITDEKGIYTNGGAYSFLNLMIYLVEKYFDRQIAIFCSKVFQIEMDRNSQSEFMIFNGQKQHDDEPIRQAQEFIETHLDEKISMEGLAARLAIGRRNFDRRFIKATGNTPVEYMQRVKVESAKKAFESSRKTINEVMYEVGYSDTKAFREVFRKITGMSPLAYKEKYRKNTGVVSPRGH